MNISVWKLSKMAAKKKVFFFTFFGLLWFLVFFNGLFAPTSWSRMSNIFRDSESLGKSNGKKWSQIWTFLFENCLKSPRKKKFIFFTFFGLLWFSVFFNGLFDPTSQSRMSDIFRDSESLGISNGKKWSHIWTFLFENRQKSPRKKMFFFADFALTKHGGNHASHCPGASSLGGRLPSAAAGQRDLGPDRQIPAFDLLDEGGWELFLSDWLTISSTDREDWPIGGLAANDWAPRPRPVYPTHPQRVTRCYNLLNAGFHCGG